MNKLLKYSFLWLFMLMGVVSANAQTTVYSVSDIINGNPNSFIIADNSIQYVGNYASEDLVWDGTKGFKFYNANLHHNFQSITPGTYLNGFSANGSVDFSYWDYSGSFDPHIGQSGKLVPVQVTNTALSSKDYLDAYIEIRGEYYGDDTSEGKRFISNGRTYTVKSADYPSITLNSNHIDDAIVKAFFWGNVSGNNTDGPDYILLVVENDHVREAGSSPIVVIDAPTFSVAAGKVLEGTEVTITGNSDKIIYTTDGSTPTLDNGTTVNGTTVTVTVNEAMTLKAIAADNDGNVSTVTTAEYTIYVPVAITTIAGYKACTDDSFDFIINSDSEYKVYFGGAHYPYYYTMYIWDGTDGVKLEAADDFTAFKNFKTGDIIQSATFKIIKSYGRKVVTSVSNIVKGENEEMPYVEVTDFSTLTESDAGKYIKVHASARYNNWGINLYDDNNNEGPQLNNDLQLKDITIADCDGKTGTFYIVLNSQWAAYPITKDYFVADAPAAVAVEIGAAGAATFSSTEALDFTDVTTVAAYIAKEAATGNSALEFTRVYKVPANTGLIVRNAAGEDDGAVSADVPVLAGEADNVEGNLFVAATEEIASLPSVDGEYTNYILNKKNGVLGFYKANGRKVAAGKAYLKMLTGSGAAEFIGFDGEVTAIESLTAENANNEIFDLQGRRVAKAAKGVYIVNGKKVVLK